MTKQYSDLTHPKYRADIDGLRAIAVLSVVIFHAFPAVLKGGFIGVDIFFVISGYLISGIIFENLARGTFSFSEFYARRVRRIFPALLLVLTVSCTFGWFALLADEYQQLGKHIAAGAGFVSNIVLWNEAGYFDGSAETKPLLHLWSLGIEEQFYIVWPLLLWLAWKRRLNFLAITIFVAALSFYLNMKGVKKDAVATFYLPQTRFWELLCGSVLAWLNLRRNSAVGMCGTGNSLQGENGKAENSASIFGNVLSLLGFLLLSYGFLRIDKALSFPGKWALVPVLGAVFIIAAGSKAWVNRMLLSNKVMVWLGLISFPLYLWHWPLLSFARIIESEVPSAAIRLAAIVLSLLLAWLTYYFLERPLRSADKGRVKVAALLALMFVVGVVGGGIYKHEGLKYRSKNIELMSSVTAEFVGPFWKYTKNAVCEHKYPFAPAEKYSWWFCMASSQEKPTLLLLGTSYANHFYPGIVHNKELKHHSVLSIGTCDAAWVERSDLSDEENQAPCSGYRSIDQLNFINSIVATEKSVRYVILGGLNDSPDINYIARLKRRVDFFEKNGVKVILFVPHVRAGYDIKGCYIRPFKDAKYNCELPVDVYKSMMKKFNVLMVSIKATNPGVLFFDQNIIFCDEDKCRFKLPVLPAFRDEHAHLSEFASDLLMQKFVAWARINVPGILSP